MRRSNPDHGADDQRRVESDCAAQQSADGNRKRGDGRRPETGAERCGGATIPKARANVVSRRHAHDTAANTGTGVFFSQRVNLSSEVNMTHITISIPDDRMQKLREKASRFQVAPEDLVRASLEDLLARPEEDFRQALEYVLSKNAELYRRLA